MKLLPLSISLVAISLAASVFSAEPTEEAKKKEEIRALILADATNKPAAAPIAKPLDEPHPAPKDEAGAVAPATEPAPAATTPKPPEEPATMLPQMEVNKSRITEIDLAVKEQEKAIAREKVNTKPTKLDDTLNNSKVTKALAIFGGSSSDERSAIAQERVRIMEEEKELLESMRLSRTPEEKAELQKELDALRAQRRELDQAPK